MKNTQADPKKIINEYLENFNQLSGDKKRHFIFRLNKIGYDSELISVGKAHTQHIIDSGYFDSILEEKFIKNEIDKFPNLKINDTPKKESFARLPDVFSLYLFLKELFYCKYFNLIQDPLEFINSKVDVKEVLDQIDDSFTTHAATYVVCIHYYLKYIGYYPTDFQLKPVFFGSFPEKMNQVVEMNYLYGLTHILIGDSYFYQKRPDQELTWVVDLLNNYEDYLKNNNLDLHIEAALVFAMYDSKFAKENEIVDSAYERIDHAFNKDLNILQRKNNESIVNAEHTNCLYLLLDFFIN